MKEGKKGIVWFRQDLRLHDNEALYDAIHHVEDIIPVYVFDERIIQGKTKFGFPKTGAHRLNFLLESVENLKQNLQKKGSDLIIRFGKPEEEIFKIARLEKTNFVFCNRERTEEEVKVQDALEKKLWSVGQEVRFSRGKMLFYTADLPFPVTHTPDSFTSFRKEVEKFIPIREPLKTEKEDLPELDVRIDLGKIPTLKELGFKKYKRDERSAFPLKGGETAALEHLDNYFWQKELAKTYKDTRNELIGLDFSTKFSAHLAHGCISPKKIFHELKRFENQRKKNESTYWIYFELMWRDFFRLMGKKHQNNIFKKGGPKQQIDPNWSNDMKLFRVWSEGRTGVPFIDANMVELKETGFMSNRGRQNVASFLIHDLGLNWQVGAEYFESLLIDYDPCSNYGNWNYLAGIGSDPRENRKFNVLSQAAKYDGDGNFVKKWIPELTNLPSEKVHRPWELTKEEQTNYKFTLGKDYPDSILSFS